MSRFHNFELELKFFAATDRTQVKLPELSGESEARPVLIDIHEQLQANHPPHIRQWNVSAHRFKPHVGVERKELPVFDKAIEWVAVEVIAVRGIGGPVRVRVMRRYDLNAPSRFGDPMKFGDKGHDVGNMFSDVAADDSVKLVVSKRIRDWAQIVNDIGVGFGIGIHADRARSFIPATTNIEGL